MWLKSFKIHNKVLSEVELVVLSSLTEEYMTVPELMEKLDQELSHWDPERGTIYPLLHRLTSQGLLEKNEGKKLEFKRSNAANSFLTSLVVSDDLLEQFETSIRFLEILAKPMIEIDPFSSREFFNSVLDRIAHFQSTFQNYRNKIDDSDDEWTEIDVN